MNKDAKLLEEAYQLILEAKKKKPDADKDGVPDWADKHPGKDDHAVKSAKSKKSSKKDSDKIEEAYLSILEATATDKVINKKLARDYYKAVKAMRKSEHGSKEYEKFKSQKEDIVKLVNDHGKTIADLDAFLTKKEKEEVTEEHQHCEAADKGCDCAGCDDCKKNQYTDSTEE